MSLVASVNLTLCHAVALYESRENVGRVQRRGCGTEYFVCSAAAGGSPVTRFADRVASETMPQNVRPCWPVSHGRAQTHNLG